MPQPTNPLRRVVDAATRGPESLLRLADLPPRVVTLLETAERAMARVDVLVTNLERTERDLRAVVERVGQSERAAREVIDAVTGTELSVEGLLVTYQPMLRALDEDVIPVMRTLGTVAPDLTELLAVSRALNELMGSLPGLGRTKKRVDEELAREQENRD